MDHRKLKKDKFEELQFEFVSDSMRKQISLLALDSLPISHEITSFSLPQKGFSGSTQKLPEELSGPGE